MAETVAERIADVLGERIVSGELAPGTPLRQDRIAEEFQASHVPAREAFHLLRSRGLVVNLPRRGVRVSPLDSASIQEIVEIRAALEALALTVAAPKMNAACFEKIEKALLAGDQAQSMIDWERANRAFHRELVTPCKMPKLLSMLDDLQLANSRIIYSASRSAGRQPGSSHAHRQIVSALRKRQFERAVSLLRAHIQNLERTSGDTAGEPREKADDIDNLL